MILREHEGGDLGTEAVESAAGTLEGVDDVEGRDGLAVVRKRVSSRLV